MPESSSPFSHLVELLPHRLPMRLVETVIDLAPGETARTERRTRADDWFFQGHFPGDPIVPAIILVELLAQTGGLAAATGEEDRGAGAGDRGSGVGDRRALASPVSLRLAALGGFKFPDAARPGETLEATARVVGRMGALIKIEGEVTADGRPVATGSLTLAHVRPT